MVGNYDRIHGYNRIYQVREENRDGNFASFEINPQGYPGQFINRPLVIAPPAESVLDHQGHIVPQSMLNKVLDPIAQKIAKSTDLRGVMSFINSKEKWLNRVIDYGNEINAPMFNFEQVQTEDRVGFFFSIIIWNPINICRAPEDKKRNNEPGDKIDTEVVKWIDQNRMNLTNVRKEWVDALMELTVKPTDVSLIKKYIDECCKTLNVQRGKGLGYYTFPWIKCMTSDGTRPTIKPRYNS